MLEHRPLGDAKAGSDIAHPRCVIAVLGEMPHGGLDDAAALGVGRRTNRGRLVEGGRESIAGDSGHMDDSKSAQHIRGKRGIQLHFCWSSSNVGSTNVAYEYYD